MPKHSREEKTYALSAVIIMLLTIVFIPLMSIPMLILVTAPLWWDS